MRLRQLYEGGNVSIGDISANRIDATKRNQVVPILDRTLQAINKHFQKFSKGTPLWNDKLLKSRQFLSGSSFSFFNIPKGELVERTVDDVNVPQENPVPTATFAKRKPSVGDIDTQIDIALKDTVAQWLASIPKGTQIGDANFVGFKPSGEQFITLWTFPSITMKDANGAEIPTNVQIDLELKQFKNGSPTSWSRFSAYSSWDDTESGIKGVFHKYLIQSLATLTKKEFALRKLKGRGNNRVEVDEPTVDNMVSFAVSSKEGGGLRAKYEPVVNPDTGKQEITNNLPVYKARPTTGYEQNIGNIFASLFDTKIKPADLKKVSDKFWSFTGLVDLINTYLDEEEQRQIMEVFTQKLFGRGAQGLYKGEPDKDEEEKSTALEKAYSILGISPPSDLKGMIDNYYSTYKVTESITEAVVTSKRQGVQHLEKMKDSDFLDLLDELKDETGENFRLDQIPMTLKIDGLGGRFGKDSSGNPFFESSRSGPITKPGSFTAHMRQQGIDDEVKMDRAVKYDQLFDEVMDAINDIDSKLGADYLNNVKVHCEILFRPMAIEENGRLKFVSVAYDNLPEGIELVLIPLFVESADTGDSHPKNDEIKQTLNNLGRLDQNAMFLDNTITTNKAIDVTGIIRPLENIDELKAMASGRSRKDKQEVKQILQPVKDALAKEVVENPNILGKYKLGKDYEGIIIYTRKGPIKVTSPQFKDMMASKAQPKTTATQRGKKCIVGYGSLMGHRGHQMLVDAVIQQAKRTNRTPFIYISPTVGADDPVSAETKRATFQKLYPKFKDAFRIVGSGADAKGVVRSGGIRGAIKFDLVPEGFTDIIVMTGDDQHEAFKFLGTDKSLKATGADSVQTMIRQEAGAVEKGVRSTELRNALKDPNLTYDQKLKKWMVGFDGKTLGKDWVEKLMKEAAKNMGIDLVTKNEPATETMHLNLKNSILETMTFGVNEDLSTLPSAETIIAIAAAAKMTPLAIKLLWKTTKGAYKVKKLADKAGIKLANKVVSK